MWGDFPQFPGLLNFRHTAYEGRYHTASGKILVSVVPVYGEYSQASPIGGPLVGFQISRTGYSGFLPLDKLQDLKDHVFAAAIRALD